MIKDDKIGLVVAETPEEEAWIETKETAEKQVKELTKALEVNKAMLELAKGKLDLINGKKKS
jgi:hypothetical protein